MKFPHLVKFIIVGAMISSPLRAEPTEMRQWRSTAGTSIEASAIRVEKGQVVLQASNGREVKVPLDKFVDEDRKILTGHFAIKEAEPGQPTSSGVPLVDGGLKYPAGEVSGPIDAGDGSHYFVYVPTSLREGRKAPMMLITGSGGGNARTAKSYAEGAEIGGWIIAASVESRNGEGHPVGNHEHAKHCVAHLLANLPVDEERVYFSGNSGGGAMSFYNALRIKSAGNMPVVGYSPDKKYDKKQYCYGIGGTRDFNRYMTAHSASQFGDNGFHRLHVGGHSGAPPWIGDEGIVWLNGRYLGDRRRDSGLDDERLDFEASLIKWIKELSGKEPYRAHYWCHFLKEEYEISGPNAGPVAELLGTLSRDPMNVRYTEGIAAINDFSSEYYADEGARRGSAMKHTTPKIEKAAEKLAAEFVGVPLIEEIARDLGSATDG